MKMRYENRLEGHSTAKAIIAYLMVIIILGVFILFKLNQEEIINSNRFQPFMLMTIVAMGFLVSLLYLVNKPVHHAKKKRK